VSFAPLLSGPGTGPVVVLVGVLSATPGLGGLSWVTLNQAAGLAQAGARVHVVDLAPDTSPVPLGSSVHAAYFDAVVDELGLASSATLVCQETAQTHGRTFAELAGICADADLVLNTGGFLRAPDLVEGPDVRAYVDLDPGFSQLWASQGADVGLDGHDAFVTVGPLLGAPGCPVPTLGRDWIGMVPPVSLPHWPEQEPRPAGAFTTVASWRGYGSVWHDGVHYGQKAHATRPLLALAERTSEDLCLALEIHADETSDIAALEAHGWGRVDPSVVAATPGRFADFVAASKGELGLAKLGYIEGRSGWFSDRSSCYLACGRPVLAADTGFGEILPTGAGLVAFSDLDGAVDGLARIAANYAAHCAAARHVAREHLDARSVMGGLLESLGVV
jgi:hypothetical protein